MLSKSNIEIILILYTRYLYQYKKIDVDNNTEAAEKLLENIDYEFNEFIEKHIILFSHNKNGTLYTINDYKLTLINYINKTL